MLTLEQTALSRLGRNHSYLRLLLGRIVSNAGDSLYYVAAMWLVFDLTGSAVYTGIAAFLIRAPAALSVFIGPLVDRWSRRRVLVGSQAINALIVLVLPGAAAVGHLTIWTLFLVLPVVTVVNQFLYPAQNAVVPQLVDEDDLTVANSLLSAGYRGADTVFNALGGIVVAAVGAVTVFLIDAITFAIAAVVLAGISLPREEAPSEKSSTEADSSYLDELRDGITIVRQSTLVTLLGGVILTNLTAGAMLGVLPAFAANFGGADTFGILMAAYAGGTFIGILGASFFDRFAFGRMLSVTFPMAGLAIVGALASPSFPVMVVLFMASFIPVGAFNVQFWALLQSTVEVDFLGRVSALVSSVGTVAIPVGALGGGVVAGIIAPWIVVLSWGIGLLFFGVYVGLTPPLRTIPPVTAATASDLGLPTTLRSQ